MSASVFKINHTGPDTIAMTATCPRGASYRVMHVTCHFAAAPTTSEDFTITLDAVAGAEYDTRLYTADPAAGATTDILWYPDEELFIVGGDQIDVAFAGTDSVQYGVQITLKAV